MNPSHVDFDQEEDASEIPGKSSNYNSFFSLSLSNFVPSTFFYSRRFKRFME